MDIRERKKSGLPWPRTSCQVFSSKPDKKKCEARRWWLMPVILLEIRRIKVQGQPEQIV
jgi:hypothetical protein